MPKLTPHLWFDMNALEAATFYAQLLPDSAVHTVTEAAADNPSTRKGEPLTVEFTLMGLRFVGINGGPMFPQTEAFSLQILCDTQDEVDHYWQALTADGGRESRCGWCKDRFGLNWQVCPRILVEYLTGPDREKAARVTEAMMPMAKLDIAALEAAAAG